MKSRVGAVRLKSGRKKKMTNKDYERLTYRPYRNEEVRCLQPDGELQDLAERLYKLENAIENRTLVFLPFAVGNEFWCFAEYYSLSDGWVNLIAKHTVHEIRILNNVIYLYDENGDEYDTSDIILYTTEEAAKKALEEMNEPRNSI